MGIIDKIASLMGGQLNPSSPEVVLPQGLRKDPARHPLTTCLRSLDFLPGMPARRTIAWVTNGTEHAVLASLPGPETWSLLGCPTIKSPAPLADKDRELAASASRKARERAYPSLTAPDAPALQRLGELFAAVADSAKIARTAGPQVPDWLYLAVQDILCHLDLPESGLAELVEPVRTNAPHLTAELLISLAVDLPPGVLVSLVLDRQVPGDDFRLDALVVAPGMGEWAASQPDFESTCLGFGRPGRESASRAIRHWGAAQRFGSLLATLSAG